MPLPRKCESFRERPPATIRSKVAEYSFFDMNISPACGGLISLALYLPETVENETCPNYRVRTMVM